MPSYLFQGCYTSAAIEALVKKPEDRTAAVRVLVESVGGKLEGFWLAFGEHDFIGIVQVPDAESAVAFAMAAGAGGGIHNFQTIPLLDWADGLKAMKKAGAAKYRPPTKPAK